MIPTRWQMWTSKDGKDNYIATMDDSYLINCYKWLSKMNENTTIIMPEYGNSTSIWTKDGFNKQEWRHAFEIELEKRGLATLELYSLFK